MLPINPGFHLKRQYVEIKLCKGVILLLKNLCSTRNRVHVKGMFQQVRREESDAELTL